MCNASYFVFEILKFPFGVDMRPDDFFNALAVEVFSLLGILARIFIVVFWFSIAMLSLVT